MKSMLVFCVFLVIGAVQCARIRRQAAAAAPATTSKTQGMNFALGFMNDELDKEKGLGGPANPAGLEKANSMTMDVQKLGGDPGAFSSLLADAAQPPQYGAGAAKPDDTKVDLSGVGA